ncbi:HNH endonuclease [Clostridium beijerinckii]|uniref:HNH endonuclease n=1 Tax=Clostridium beijerinckii TaxID=1520 RepID=UPI00047D3306|nr:HNH endonuclease [Clostridium beijerinckii]
MLKSCYRCGRVHEHSFKCQAMKVQRIKPNTIANKFRNTQAWKKKRKIVFDRDKGLCQLCIRNLYDTYGRIYNNSIEVHHIEPINENYDLRLEDSNLISLCTYHHKRADRGEISREVLKDIIKNRIYK